MRVSLVWAMDEHGIIGRDGRLPWHLPEDLRQFRALTEGHTLLLGRRTWDSLPRKPLPGRRCLVLTRNPAFTALGATVVHDLDDALDDAAATGEDELFVAGGAEVYRLAWPRADHLHVTLVHGTFEGDVRFPELDWSRFELRDESAHQGFTVRRYAARPDR